MTTDTDPSVERFRMLDLSDDAPASPLPDDGPVRRPMIDDPDDMDQRDLARLQRIDPRAGEKIDVAGAPGWYGAGTGPTKGIKALGSRQWGDTFFRSGSSAGFGSGTTAPGIASVNGEGAAQRARRLGGLDWTTRLEPVTRADGGQVDVPRYFVVRNDTGDALSMVGKVAAQLGKGDPSQAIDPAPDLLQPSALDVLDDIGEFRIAQGGVIGGTIPWLQADPISFDLDGTQMIVRPIVRNPLDGSGSMALALPSGSLDCRNLYVAMFGGRKGVIRFRHCQSGSDAFAAMRETLASQVAPDGAKLQARIKRMRSMWSVKVTMKMLEETVLPTIFGFDASESFADLSKHKQNRIERWMDSYQNAPGARPGIAGGVLQATTFLTSHLWSADDSGATDEQLWSGSAGALEERAHQTVSLIASMQ